MIKHTSFLILLIFVVGFVKGQTDEPHYKSFESDEYDIYVEANELLGNQVGLKRKKTGRIVLKAKYDDIVSVKGKYVRIIKDTKWGIVDTLGNIVIPVKYNHCSNMGGGRIFIANTQDKYALANSAGQLLTKHLFDDYDWNYFNEEVSAIKNNNLWGFINKEGLVTIPIKYSKVYLPIDGKIRVQTKEFENVRLGTIQEMDKPWTERPSDVTFASLNEYIINLAGKTIFTSKDHLSILKDGSVVTYKNYDDCVIPANDNWSNFELYDKSLKKIVSFKACWAYRIIDGIVIVKNGSNKYGIFPLADINAANLIKTPYVKCDINEYASPNIYSDKRGSKYYKFYKDNENFVCINIETSECIEVEGASKCE